MIRKHDQNDLTNIYILLQRLLCHCKVKWVSSLYKAKGNSECFHLHLPVLSSLQGGAKNDSINNSNNNNNKNKCYYYYDYNNGKKKKKNVPDLFLFNGFGSSGFSVIHLLNVTSDPVLVVWVGDTQFKAALCVYPENTRGRQATLKLKTWTDKWIHLTHQDKRCTAELTLWPWCRNLFPPPECCSSESPAPGVSL